MLAQACWVLKDFILRYGAAARGRGGWAHFSSDIAAQTASASYIKGGVYAAFSNTAGTDADKNLAVDEDGLLFSVASNTATLIGAARVLRQNPVFMGGAAATAATSVSAVFTGLAIFPDGTGLAVPKKYNGTTLSDLNGLPPKARFATVYKNYLALGNGTSHAISAGSAITGVNVYYPYRLWFSPIGDPDVAIPATSAETAWNTLDAWIDFSLPIIGLGATKNALIVFHDGQVSRVRGHTAPPEEDMEVDDPFLRVGLLDPFSITEYKDNVYWCAPEGVFRTDGVVLDDLTKKGGMIRPWLDMTAGQSVSSYSFATGVIRDFLIISVMNGTTFVDAYMLDLPSSVWTRRTNLDATSLWTGQINVADELFFGRRGAARVGRLDSIFSVGQSAFKNDGDGDAVVPTLETMYYELGEPGLKRVKRLFVGYELVDYASDNPTVAVSYIENPEETSYTALASLGETAGGYKRVTVDVNDRLHGLALKFAQANAGDFHLHDIELEVAPQETSKRDG